MSYLGLYSAEYHAHHMSWAQKQSRIYRHYRDEYCELVRPQPGMRILELGCSSRKTTRILAEKGAQVLAVDFDPNAIQMAKEWIQSSSVSDRVKFHCGSADEVNISGSNYDVITMLDFVEHVPDQLLEKIFKNITGSGFHGLVHVYTPDSRHFTEVMRRVGLIAQDQTHINLKSLPEWRTFFEANGMTICRERRASSHWPVLSSLERCFNGLPIVGPRLIRSIAMSLQVVS